MKLKLFFITSSIVFSIALFGQKIIKKNGIYINEKGEKYSGVYISYFENGNKKAVYTVKKGKENGSVEFFYPSSEIMEQGFFNNGNKDGKWVRWSNNGSKLAEANYKKGKKDGKWIIWDERGVKRYEMYYENGKKIGTWIIWDEKGQISNKKDY